MKVLLLSTNDILGGAAVVTYRLMHALRGEGVDARMLVANRQTVDECVGEVGQARLKAAFVAERGEIFLNNGLNRSDLWKVSTARFGADVCAHQWVKDADVIVLNWINQGLLSLSQLRCLCRMDKPIVWVMHDLWCATGICHLPGECRRFEQQCGHCPFLHKSPDCFNDLSHRIWKKKRGIFAENNIRFVAVSSWQRSQAMSGTLMKDKDIVVIPHAFPIEEYHTSPQEGDKGSVLDSFVNSSKHIIVMGAARLDDPIKDLPMAIESLNLLAQKYPDLAKDCEAVFFGAVKDADAFSLMKFPYRHVGMLDASELRQLYSASTVVLSTSRFETMGATLMEGMASGATPVTFGRGGQADIVTHGENGYIADYGSVQSVADCLAKAIRSPFNRQAQHLSVASRFSASAIARQYIELFNQLA